MSLCPHDVYSRLDPLLRPAVSAGLLSRHHIAHKGLLEIIIIVISGSSTFGNIHFQVRW